MNHPRRRTRNRGFQLTAEAAAFLDEQYERRHRLTPEGKEEIEKQSHWQLVDEAIEEMEQEEAQNHDPR